MGAASLAERTRRELDRVAGRTSSGLDDISSLTATEARVVEQLGDPGRQPGRGEAEVEEAGPGHLGRLEAAALEVEGGGQHLGDVAGRAAADPLGEGHGPVRLVVPEARVGGGPDHGVGVGGFREGRGDGCPQGSVEGEGGIGHPPGILATGPGTPGTILPWVPPS